MKKEHFINEELYALVKKAYAQMLCSVDETIAPKVQKYIDLGMNKLKAEEKLLSYYQEIALADRSPEMEIVHKNKTLITDFGERIDDEEQSEVSIRNLTNAIFRYNANILDQFETADKFVEFIQEKLLIREAIERLKPPPKPDTVGKKFEDIFTKDDFRKYIDVLTACEPPLLEKADSGYKFIGNKNIHTGCVGQWFNFLKTKGVVSPKASRRLIADVLNNEIENFHISHASVEYLNEKYQKFFDKQLTDAFEKL